MTLEQGAKSKEKGLDFFKTIHPLGFEIDWFKEISLTVRRGGRSLFFQRLALSLSK
jgi:hypothetical protein